MASLTNLYPELLIMVAEWLPKSDLKSLSSVSRNVHEILKTTLWRSVTIQPESEFALHRIEVIGFPQTALNCATQLHLRSEIKYNADYRCLHEEDEETDDDEVYDEDYDDECQDEDDEDEDEGKGDDATHSRFSRLTRRATTLINRLKAGQLRSFSWDLGTCVPSEILGPNGIVSLKQRSLKSLSLTTDYTCRRYSEYDCTIDLSSFHELTSLCWRAPKAGDFEAMFTAIRGNTKCLAQLELDFISWENLCDDLGLENADEDKRLGFFLGRIGPLDGSMPRPIFPALRALSLSQVPLVPAMAQAVDFRVLQSLTLRQCSDWDQFLHRVIELELPVALKTLEVHSLQSDPEQDALLGKFLETFGGLEELFIGLMDPTETFQLCNSIGHHKATLKRLVQHHRTTTVFNDVPDAEVDLPNLGISSVLLDLIHQEPHENPMMGLKLESIGLACDPELMKSLLPSTLATSLKLLHVRQSVSDLRETFCWAFDHRPPFGAEVSDSSADETLESDRSDESGSDHPTSEWGSVPSRTVIQDLTDEFRRFAEWVFGPQGLPSLDVLAYGDFSHGDQSGRMNIILERDLNGARRFRLLAKNSTRWKRLLEMYSNVLEACPLEPLLGD